MISILFGMPSVDVRAAIRGPPTQRWVCPRWGCGVAWRQLPFYLRLGSAEIAIGWLVRLRYPKRSKRVATPRICPDCGCRRCEELGGIRGNLRIRLKCNAGGEQSVTYRYVTTENKS